MHKFKTTEDFIYKGTAYPGIPALVDDEERPVSVVNSFMLHLYFSVGRVDSPKTLDNYIEALSDYFSWLEAQTDANGNQILFWDQQPKKTSIGLEPSNLALYQKWSQSVYKKPNGRPLSYSTINQRTSCIRRFYKWAKDEAQLINFSPVSITLVAVGGKRHPDALAHTHGQRLVESSNLTLKTQVKLPKLLSLAECKELLSLTMSQTVRVMTRLMLASGIRNEECRTFPREYVFDPTGLDKRKRIKIALDPDDMKLKNNTPRTIYISWQMMKELYEYTQFGEGVEREKRYKKKHGTASPHLFLNEQGGFWSDKGLNNKYSKLWKGYKQHGRKYPPVITFKVAPHMLRHTFATMELYHESNAVDRKTGKAKGSGHGLMWVKERLGHKSIQTTTIYTHCLSALETPELNDYQTELDAMLTGGAHG